MIHEQKQRQKQNMNPKTNIDAQSKAITLQSLARLLLGAAVLSATSLSIAADAAAPLVTPPSSAGGDETVKLPDLIVSASKTDTPVSITPAAVTLLTGEDLIRNNINTVQDLQGFVPGLLVAENGQQGTLQISLRGIFSSNDTELGSPAVGMYLDGVYLPKASAGLNLLDDIQQIEVLRGPQGTLFGRNSTVGTIDVISPHPDLESNLGSFSIGVGNLNDQTLHAMLNVVLVPKHLAARFSYAQETRDSWVNQVSNMASYDGTGADNIDQDRNHPVGANNFYYNRNLRAFRASLYFVPVDRVRLFLSYDHYIDHSAGSAVLMDTSLAADTPAAYQGAGKFEPLAVNVPGALRGDDKIFRANLQVDLTDWVRLESISGYQHLVHNPIVDVDGGQGASAPWTGAYNSNGSAAYYPNYANNQFLEWDGTFTDALSEELQLKSRNNPRLNWIAGVYYDKDTGDMNQYDEYPTYYGFNTPTVVNGPFVYNFVTQGININSKAAFAQIDYAITKDLHLTLGGRRTEDNLGFAFEGQYSNDSPVDPSIFFNPPLTAPSGGGLWYTAADFTTGNRKLTDFPLVSATNGEKIGWGRDTWRAGLDYKIPSFKDVFLYTSLATGYKSGNVTIPFPDQFLNFAPSHFLNFQANPEEVTTLEAGIKGTFLDNSLRVRLAAYTSEYHDYQLFDFVNIKMTFLVQGAGQQPTVLFSQQVQPLVTQNIGSVAMSGFEGEFAWQPWSNGQFTGNFTIENNHIDQFNPVAYSQVWFPNILAQNPQLTQGYNPSLLGKRLPRTPEFTGSIGYEHSLHFLNYDVVPRVSVTYTSSYFNSITNFAVGAFSSEQQPVTLGNANIRIAKHGSRWWIDLWCRNVTNKQFMNGANVEPINAGSAGQIGAVEGEWSDPRTYGVTAGVSF